MSNYPSWNPNYGNSPTSPPPPPPPPYSAPGYAGVQQTYAYNYNYSNYVQAPPPPGYNQNYYPNAQIVPPPLYQGGQLQQPSYHHQHQKRNNKKSPSNSKRRKMEQKTTINNSSNCNNSNGNDNVPKKSWPCKVCKIDLDSETAYQAHVKSHIKCSSCDFEAAPKVVKAHHQSVHGKFSKGGFKTVTVAIPGCKVQRFRICVGNRPEDVQKWIAERKKRFPRSTNTSANISQDSMANMESSQKKKLIEETEIDAKNSVKTLATGLSSLLDGYGSSSDEDEVEKEDIVAVEKSSTEEPKRNTEQEETDRNETTTTEETASSEHKQSEGGRLSEHSNLNDEAQSNTKKRICRFFARNGTCRNGDACRFRHEMPDSTSKKQASSMSSNQQRTKKRKEPPSSLLRSLLSNDIQRENTLTLQLLRYIVDSNFFDDEVEK